MPSEPWMVLIWTGGRLECLKLRLGLQGASFEHQSMASYSLERRFEAVFVRGWQFRWTVLSYVLLCLGCTDGLLFEKHNRV
ncbi:BnaA04g29210D [Brassica napus]|uniref:BnaA04g29210D protein n=1 Tax=Brassica napus TaxID=3708 RepID=A0A078IVE8_BRANA|nr:BnaA04g29210D [Brassica napus]